MVCIGKSCVGVAFALILLLLLVNRAGAWGAVAVGMSDNTTISATAAGKATESDAQEAALLACRTPAKGVPASSGVDKARSLCAAVTTFQNQCVATAGSQWAIAANEQEAREAVSAKCRATAGCTVNAYCDKQPSQKQCTFSIFGYCVW
jgi:hypothetical protein